jgi:alpha/beta superfamily hydrolase
MNTINYFPTEDTFSFFLPGKMGDLEILTSTPSELLKNTTVVICHPHPLYGGTMHNKVVYTLARAFQQMGLRAVRFNYRGVGKSQGEYGEGKGETDDLLTVLNWVKQVRPNDSIWLAGFSFGGYVAARGASLWPTEQLILVAPSVCHFQFDFPIDASLLVIQGDKDEIVPPEAVFKWAESLPHKPQVIRMHEAGHFFHGRLTELRNLIVENLSS